MPSKTPPRSAAPAKATTTKKTNSGASRYRRDPAASATPPEPKPPRRRSFWRWLWMPCVVFVLMTLSYVGYLDYTVRHQFEGKRWALPARVYAHPVELYTGYPLTAQDMENLLIRLHYQNDNQLSGEGTYLRTGQRVQLKTRAFDFWDGHQDSARLQIDFAGGAVTRVWNLDQSQETALLRMDPEQIGSFYPSRKEDRILIKLEEAPKGLIDGLLATEDRDFYTHFGLSPRAILRAIWVNVRAGGIVQGGSTITQQLVKNFYLTAERSLWRKINEALMALILEYRYEKSEILEAYLNEVYLGQDGASAVHGFGLASEFYFGRPLKDLKLPQIAMLVALVRGPSYYDPRRAPERARKRRNLVLDAMHEQQFISAQAAEQAKQTPLSVIPYTHRPANRYPGFLDLVRRQLIQDYPENVLTSEGLRIFTTLDTQIQDTLQETIKLRLAKLEKKMAANTLEAAVVVTRRDNGEIVALSSGRDQQGSGFNRALDALRPIGSLIKPAIYLTALSYPQRYTVITRISDSAIRLKSGNKVWTPHNYDRKEHGEVPLYQALAQSYNLSTVRLGMDLGIARVAKTLRELGVNRPIDLYPSLLLGALPLTPIEVAQMYQTLASDGFMTPLRAIRGVIAADGKPLQQYPYTPRQMLDPGAVYLTNTLLQEVMTSGTGKSAYHYFPAGFKLAGKTGTTDELRDSWFAGFSGDYLAVVWVGRDDNQPAGLSGASGALQVWNAFMRQVAKQPALLLPPDNIDQVWIDPVSGGRSAENCPGARRFPFIKGSAPTHSAPCAAVPESNWFEQLW